MSVHELRFRAWLIELRSVKGSYYNEKAYALRGTVQGLVPREVINLYLEASKAFVDAATCYPVDDELYPCETIYTLTAGNHDRSRPLTTQGTCTALYARCWTVSGDSRVCSQSWTV